MSTKQLKQRIVGLQKAFDRIDAYAGLETKWIARQDDSNRGSK